MNLPIDRLSRLDETSGVPKYRQIVAQLVALLEETPPGTRLPSEPALARHLGVSRNTAVQALDELRRRGLAVRKQGWGTLSTARHRAVRSLESGRLSSFSEDLRQGGYSTSEEVVSCECLALPDETARLLGGLPGDLAWRAERVIHCDGSPVVHVRSWLPSALYPSVDPGRVATTSLYETLEVAGAGRPHSADEEWSAAAADEHIAGLLGLTIDTPVMCCRRTAYLIDGKPAEYSVSSVAGGDFAIEVRISPASYGSGAAPALRAGPV